MKVEDIKLKGKVVGFASSNNGKPHNIAVEVNLVKNNQIVITNNQMNETIKNIKVNPSVSLVYWDNDNGFSIDGKAKYYDSGKWFEFVKNLKENEGFDPKGAVVIDVENVKKLG